MKVKGLKQSSPVTRSSKDHQYGPEKQPDGSDSGGADSAVWSEASMPRSIDFLEPQPRNFRKHMEGTSTNSHEEPDRMSLCSEQSKPIGPSFSEDNNDESLIHQSAVCKLCEGSCGVCFGNVHRPVKHCKTCSVSYCETHVADHYKSPAFSSHELVDYKQTSRESPAKQRSLQRSSSGILWMLLIFLSVLTALIFHHCYEDPVELPELRVMMLGKTGAGKSASGNTILGREAFKSKASALPVTQSCDSQSVVVEGRNITVIDTPAITTRKAAWLPERVDPGPHVFLLVIPLGRFTEEDGEEVKWIQRNFGEEALKFTIVLFTGGDQMDQIKEQFLKESSGLQTLVGSTGGGYHIFDNKTPRGHGQVKGLLEKIELLLRKNMGYSYSYGLQEQVTTAVREEKERERREEERERREDDRREEESKRRENEQERREEERERREEERKIREKERERREGERKIREKERERREKEREKGEKERERGEEKREKGEKERERREEERERREEEREKGEKEREKGEKERDREEEKREIREEEREIREDEREIREERMEIREERMEIREERMERGEEKRERREKERERREKEREKGEKEREKGEKERDREEEKREIREEERDREEEKREIREEEREIREEERERTTEQSWNWRNILNGFIGFVLPDILWKC